MAGVEGTNNYPTDNGSRHAIGLYEPVAALFYWLRCTAVTFLLKVVEQAAPTTAQAVVSIPTTAGGTLLKAANATRRVLWVFNDSGVRIYVGDSGVSATVGYPVEPKAQFPWTATKACYALSTSGTVSVFYIDVSD